MSAAATLARVAKSRAEEIQRALAEADAYAEACAQRIVAHDARVKAEQQAAASSPFASYAAYATAALIRRAGLVSEHARATAEAQALRATLTEAFVEMKKLETLAENEIAAARAEEARREQADLDETAGRRAG
ncbi:MAG: flagellar FliJ family protein [Hyphomonadaceae bacterium]